MKKLFALGVLATLFAGTGSALASSPSHDGFDGYLLGVVRTGDR